MGLLMATVPLVQLVSAPLWGRLSDRVGRKPVLLIGMGAAVVASVLLALADSLPALFVSLNGCRSGLASLSSSKIGPARAPLSPLRRS